MFFLAWILGGCGPLADHCNQKAGTYFQKNDLAGAQKWFARAVFLDGSNPAYHNNLGYVLYCSKDYGGAEKEYSKAMASNPEGGLARQIKLDQAILYTDPTALASSPNRRDWNQKGEAVLTELLREDPRNAELHMRLGFSYFQGANPGGGFLELDKAVQFATPQEVSRYSQDPVGGALFILKNVERFYIQAHYLKKIGGIEAKIQKLSKAKNSPR